MNKKIDYGHLVESFVFLPHIGISWMQINEFGQKAWWIELSWLFWYVNIRVE